MARIKLPPGRLLISALLISALCVFPDGYHLGVVNIPQSILERFVNNSWYSHYGDPLDGYSLSIVWAVIVNTYSVGGILGAWSTMFLAERFGRKCTLLVINNAIAIAASLLMGLSKTAGSFELLMLGRFVVGFNSGLATSLLGMYLTECSPTEFRGLIASFVNLFITATTLLSQIIALPELLGTETLWPWLLGLAAAPALIQLAIFWKFPESPKHLLLTSKDEIKAKESVKFFHGDNTNMESVFEEFRKEKELANEELSLKSALSDFDLLWPILISAVVNFAQNATGISAIFSYSTSIFQSVGIGERQASLASMVTSIFNLTGALIGLPLIERCGRRPLLLGGLVACLICDIMFMTFSLWAQYDSSQEWAHYVCLLAIVMHVTLFNVGPGPIAWFISSEATPQSVRSIGASVSITVNWTAALLFGLIYLPLQEAVGAWSFLLFIVPTGLSTAFLWVKMPETKNRTIDQIMQTWSKKGNATADRAIGTNCVELEGSNC